TKSGRAESLPSPPQRGRGLPEPTYYRARRKVTRSCFSADVNWSSRTRLKNSTVSSRVSSRPSWRYGGESLTPRSGKVLIGPSDGGLRALAIGGLEKRSGFRLGIDRSV